MPIPAFLENGFLPAGVHLADVTEVEDRFGKSTLKRRTLFKRLQLFRTLAHHCGALRMLINGSFITSEPNPGDVDVVIRLDQFHEELVDQGDSKALELEMMFLSREPKEAFPAYFEDRWEDWISFFANVKGSAALQKGLVEIKP